MRRFASVLLLSALGLASCGEEETVIFDRELQHATGLHLSLPEGFDARMTARGVVLTESGGVRTPQTISVELAPQAPELQDEKRRQLGSETAIYRIADVGAGSGGTEYELTAGKRVSDVWIVLTAVTQTEGATPGFEAGWGVLERARYRE